MQIDLIINNFGVMIAIILGVWAIISPHGTAKFVGINWEEERGISEVRATYGGLFLAIGLFCLITQNEFAFSAFGYGWLGAAIVRLFSVFYDKATAKENVGGIFFEGFLAFLFLI